MDRTRIRAFYGQKAVIDNNVLCDFLELEDCFHTPILPLLSKVFSKVVIPKVILDGEVIVSQHRLASLPYQAGLISTEVGYQTIIDLLDNRLSGLSSYDIHVIALSAELGHTCVSNDNLIRKTCQRYSLDCTGTIGVLLCALEHSLLPPTDLVLYLDYLLSDQSSSFIGPVLQNDIIEYLAQLDLVFAN